MQMYYGNMPIKGINIKCYEQDTNDATIVPSAMQSGLTAYAKGKKVTGTGKSFEFAHYGDLTTNTPTWIPSGINVIELSSVIYPIKLNMDLSGVKNLNFSVPQNIATVIINGMDYSLTVSVESNLLTVICDQNFKLQAFYGKDNYA